MQVGATKDLRKYDKVAEILNSLGLTTISLLTDNEKKVCELSNYGIKINLTRGLGID